MFFVRNYFSVAGGQFRGKLLEEDICAEANLQHTALC